MIDLLMTALAAAVVASPKLAEPVQRCEIRTQAWCLVQSGTLFDVETIDYNKRVWMLRDKMFGSERIRIVEDRACSSHPSNAQKKLEGLQAASLDGSHKYVIMWQLHREGTCNLSIEIPLTNGVRNPVIYEVVLSALKACQDEGCAGPTLGATPSVEAPHTHPK